MYIENMFTFVVRLFECPVCHV